MISSIPVASDILCNTVTSTTTGVISIPAGRWYTATVVISASMTTSTNGIPNVTFVWEVGTTNAGPENGTVLHQLALAETNRPLYSAATIDLLVYGGDNGAHLNFNSGGADLVSCTINGFLV